MAEVLWPLAVFAVEALALHSHGPVACPLSSYQCWRLALRSCHAIGVRRFAIFPSELTAKMRCVGEAAGRCNIGYRSVRTRQQPGRHPYPNLSSVRVWRFPGFGSKQPLKLPDGHLETSGKFSQAQWLPNVLLHQQDGPPYLGVCCGVETWRVRLMSAPLLGIIPHHDAQRLLHDSRLDMAHQDSCCHIN